MQGHVVRSAAARDVEQHLRIVRDLAAGAREHRVAVIHARDDGPFAVQDAALDHDGAAQAQVPLDAQVPAHEKSPALYGNFGTGLVRWEPGGAALTPVPLGAAPLKFTFAPDGQRLLVLTADGQLHALDARTGRVLRSAALVPTHNAADKAAVRPTFTLGETRAYVTSPATGEVIGVNLTDLSVQARMNVGGKPALIAVTTASGEQH